jgi:hypothetical protein
MQKEKPFREGIEKNPLSPFSPKPFYRMAVIASHPDERW